MALIFPRVRACAVWLLIFTAASGVAEANITRITGPVQVASEGKAVIKFDAAFDTINQKYLVVWGTQGPGPTVGQFLNVNGVPEGPQFAISIGAPQSGWARVVYSQAQQRFFVVYTKILGTNLHQRTARMLAYTPNGPSFLTGEIWLDTFGPAGDAGGVAYSPGAGVFLAAWQRPVDGAPHWNTFLSAISPSGQVLATHHITDPVDGQSDPEIACADNGRCLVVGWSIGALVGVVNTVWGRFIDGAGTPVGASSFYIDSFTPQGDPRVAYSTQTGRFLVVFSRGGGSIWGKTLGPGGDLGSAFLIRPAGGSGSGYGLPSLSYNTSSHTFGLGMGAWTAWAGIQELDSSGNPIGASDFLPGPTWPEEGTKFVVSVADPINGRFMVLDNQAYVQLRASGYQAGPPPLDSDGDGIPDSVDQCPTIPGAPPTGCPAIPVADADSDGIPDHLDQCPTVPGNTANGCPAVAPPLPVQDLNSDGKADLVFQNGDGQLHVWHMNSWQVIGSAPLSQTQRAAPWTMVSARDLTGDGQVDLLWHNPQSGTLNLWKMSGSTKVSEQSWAVANNWVPVATGDMNGDGHADIVWEDFSAGSLFIWFMHPAGGQAGFAGVGGAFFGDYVRDNNGAVIAIGATQWRVAGIGDINADGKGDLVLQYDQPLGSSVKSELHCWFMNGQRVTSVAAFNPRYINADWRIRSVADFNGDSLPDFIFRNESSGHLYIYFMVGLNLSSVHGYLNNANPVNLGWRLVGVK